MLNSICRYHIHPGGLTETCVRWILVYWFAHFSIFEPIIDSGAVSNAWVAFERVTETLSALREESLAPQINAFRNRPRTSHCLTLKQQIHNKDWYRMLRDYTERDYTVKRFTTEIELSLWYSLKVLSPLRTNGLCKHQLHQCTLITILPAVPSITISPAFQGKDIACEYSACPHPSINLGTKCGPKLSTWSVMHPILNIKSAGLTTGNYSHLSTPWSTPGSAPHKDWCAAPAFGSPHMSSVSSSVSFSLGEAKHQPQSLALLE